MTGAKPPKIVFSHVRVIHMHVHMHWHKQNAIKKHWLQKKQAEKRKEKFSEDFFSPLLTSGVQFFTIVLWHN